MKTGCRCSAGHAGQPAPSAQVKAAKLASGRARSRRPSAWPDRCGARAVRRARTRSRGTWNGRNKLVVRYRSVGSAGASEQISGRLGWTSPMIGHLVSRTRTIYSRCSAGPLAAHGLVELTKPVPRYRRGRCATRAPGRQARQGFIIDEVSSPAALHEAATGRSLRANTDVTIIGDVQLQAARDRHLAQALDQPAVLSTRLVAPFHVLVTGPRTASTRTGRRSPARAPRRFGHVSRQPAVDRELGRSLTWAHGAEMARHARLGSPPASGVLHATRSAAAGRGTNENIDGLSASTSPRAPISRTSLALGAHQANVARRAQHQVPRKTLGGRPSASRHARRAPHRRC